MNIFGLIKNLMNGNERTKNIKRNVVGSFVIKLMNIITSLLLVPLTIDYVNPTQYGIWLTLSSIIAWIAYFDIGLSLGFKNRFAESIAMHENERAKQYVSTTYFAMFIVFIPIAIICLIINQFLNWPSIINVEANYLNELRRVFNVLIVCFCSNMILKVACTMLDGDQRPALSSLINTTGQIATLLIIYLMKLHIEGNLFNLSLAYSVVPIIVLIIATIIIFKNNRYKEFSPSPNNIRIKLIKNIMTLGLNFFIIMISMLFIFQMINIIISRNLGPEIVTQYNIAFKYFSVLDMSFTIILAPFWAAFTDAYIKNDIEWMKSSQKKLEKMAFLSIPVFLIMLLLSPIAYKIWIGEKIFIPIAISASVVIYRMSSLFGSVYMYLINGIGKVRLQLIIYLTFALIAVPLMNTACKMYGVVGLLAIPSLVFFIQAVVGRIQLIKLINHTDTGLWSK